MASSSSSTPLVDLLASFWAAIDGRALSALERNTTAAVFLSSLLECIVFLVKRVRNDPPSHMVLFGSSQLQGVVALDWEKELRALVSDQFGRIWEGLSSRRLRAEHPAAGRLVAQTLVSLCRIEGGEESS
jgi:hypothetical protein